MRALDSARGRARNLLRFRITSGEARKISVEWMRNKFRAPILAASSRPVVWQPSRLVFIRTTISQNLRTPRKFFLLVLVLVLDWVSGLDYAYEDDDEDDSVAAAPLRVDSWLIEL